MDSKSSNPFPSHETEPAPPPSYIESESTNPSSSTSQYYSTQIQHQLRDITTTIASLQTQTYLLSHAQDEKVLSLLTLHIQNYLSEFAKTGLQKGTLILVPRKGLEDENSLPSRYDFKNPKEYDQVVRVGDKEDVISGAERGFDSSAEAGSGELWYWRDEKMARRLAGYLRPEKDPRTMRPPPPTKEELMLQQQQQAENSSSSRSGFWGVRKVSAKKVEKVPLSNDQTTRDIKVEPAVAEDQVLMDVKAEEVVFRTENDLGIYESRSGWSIVLELRVVLGAQ